MTARGDAGTMTAGTSGGLCRMTFLELAPLPGAVPCARLHAVSVLRELGLRDLADDAELIVSELVTNAVRAAREVAAPAGSPPVRLRLTVWEQSVQVEVWDASDDMPHPGPAGPHDGTGGRGLLIVAALADRHGAYRTEGGGKCAWATLSTAASSPGAIG